jgi:hypothetical protein
MTHTTAPIANRFGEDEDHSSRYSASPPSHRSSSWSKKSSPEECQEDYPTTQQQFACVSYDSEKRNQSRKIATHESVSLENTDNRCICQPHQADEGISELPPSTTQQPNFLESVPGAYAISSASHEPRRRVFDILHPSQSSALSHEEEQIPSFQSMNSEAPDHLVSATLVNDDQEAFTGPLVAEAKPIRRSNRLFLALAVLVLTMTAAVIVSVLISNSGRDGSSASPDDYKVVSTETPATFAATVEPTVIPTIHSPWTENGDYIITGWAKDDFLGASIAFSTNGRIMATGAPGAGSLAGEVRVFRIQNETWTLMGQVLRGISPMDLLGFSVALSGDGLTLATGATVFGVVSDSPGYVLVFHYDVEEELWKPRGNPIHGDAGGENFGQSISLTEDGHLLAIGAPFLVNGLEPGFVKVYGWNATDWEQVGGTIQGDNTGDEFGVIVDMSTDGAILAVGAHQGYTTDQNPGYVRVFRLVQNEWQPIGDDLAGATNGEQFGWVVKLSDDGSIMAVASVMAMDGRGHVSVYRNAPNVSSWVQLGQKLVGRNAGDAFGISLELSGSGTTIAVGSWRPDSGIDRPLYARIFRLEEDNWSKVGSDIETLNDGPPVAYVDFGLSVTISRDGSWFGLGNMYDSGQSESGATLTNAGSVAAYEIMAKE